MLKKLWKIHKNKKNLNLYCKWQQKLFVLLEKVELVIFKTFNFSVFVNPNK